MTLREAGSDEYHVDALPGASVTTWASIETVTRSARIVATEKGIVSESALDDTSANETAANRSSDRRMTLGDLARGADLARWDVGTPAEPNGSAPMQVYAARIESAPVRRSLLGGATATDANATVLWVGLNARDSTARPERLRLHQWTRSYAPPTQETRIGGGGRLERRTGDRRRSRYVQFVRPRSDRGRGTVQPDLRPRRVGGS